MPVRAAEGEALQLCLEHVINLQRPWTEVFGPTLKTRLFFTAAPLLSHFSSLHQFIDALRVFLEEVFVVITDNHNYQKTNKP